MNYIEPADDFLHVCDYKGYFNGKKYYIDKTKKGYIASRGYRDSASYTARTLKDLFDTLSKVTI
jgi:hypothetical protein